MKTIKRLSAHTSILWLIYLGLLGVLLPHTAWAFAMFEPVKTAWLAWLAAIVFEGAIAAFTWRLSQRLDATPRYTAGWVWGRKLAHRYLNVYALALLIAIAVSSLANWAHAIEFGQTFAVFARYSVSPSLYALAFGGILPACSLLFAHILADVTENERKDDPALAQAREKVKALNAEIKRLNADLVASEQARAQTEHDASLTIALFGPDKSERILTARERWPRLPQAAIAVVTETSKGYVSDVLSNNGGELK